MLYLINKRLCVLVIGTFTRTPEGKSRIEMANRQAAKVMKPNHYTMRSAAEYQSLFQIQGLCLPNIFSLINLLLFSYNWIYKVAMLLARHRFLQGSGNSMISS